jgi:hemerythrin-like domain-containing protein
MDSTDGRRRFLYAAGFLGAGLMMVGCKNSNKSSNEGSSKSENKQNKEMGGEVTATEDLMREHGVLRRALLVYTAAASQLRGAPATVPPDVLQKTAKLFRAFGEDYHEKSLEEAFIFPTVKRTSGPAATLSDILISQHQRGREITDYILATAASGSRFGPTNAAALAQSLDAFVLMYGHHAAREDTIISPAWKKTLTSDQLNEMNEKFEDIEHQQFGKDGFDDAVTQGEDIESALGLADLAKFTAPPPPAK